MNNVGLRYVCLWFTDSTIKLVEFYQIAICIAIRICRLLQAVSSYTFSFMTLSTSISPRCAISGYRILNWKLWILHPWLQFGIRYIATSSLSDLNMIRSGIPLLKIVISGSTCRLNIYFQSQTRLDVLVYPAECCALVDIWTWLNFPATIVTILRANARRKARSSLLHVRFSWFGIILYLYTGRGPPVL